MKVTKNMKITILGTRGEIEPTAPRHARHSGLLIDDCLLFDLGQEEFLAYKPTQIFITHLHPDHAFFIRKPGYNFSQRVQIYAPEKIAQKQLKIISRQQKFGPYIITPIPTEHSLRVKSQGYIIQKGHEKIFYTGDMFWIKKKYWPKLKNLDLVITEGSFLREGGVIRRMHDRTKAPFGHAGIPNLIRFFKPFTDTIVLMHFGSWFYDRGAGAARHVLKKLEKTYGIKLLVAYDGYTIDTHKMAPGR